MTVAFVSLIAFICLSSASSPRDLNIRARLDHSGLNDAGQVAAAADDHVFQPRVDRVQNVAGLARLLELHDHVADLKLSPRLHVLYIYPQHRQILAHAARPNSE